MQLVKVTPLALQFFTAILIAASFPLQVFFGSPLPSLLPYVLLSAAVASRITHPQMRKPIREGYSGTDGLILAYVFLILLHMLFHVFDAEIINLQGLLANAANFLLPVGFYLYFRYFGLGDLRALMSGVLVASLVIGGVSAFHSYEKMNILGPQILNSPEIPVIVLEGEPCVRKPNGTSTLYDLVEHYQWKAAEYSKVRSNQDESSLCKSFRFSSGRTGGLLENHAVNAVWTGLGMLAALVVNLGLYGWMRIAVVLTIGGFLVLSQYYTGIFAFCLVTLMILVRHLHITFAWRNIHDGVILFGVCLVVCFFVLMLKPEIVLVLNLLTTERIEMLVNGYWQTIFVGKFQDWMAWVLHFPAGLFIGDGLGIYYPYSFNKGGDIGLIESLAKLGLPFCAFFVLWVASRVRGTWRMVKNTTASDDLNNGFYYLCLILLIAINEIHYSVWSAKAVLPLLFVAIAALHRLSSDRSIAE